MTKAIQSILLLLLITTNIFAVEMLISDTIEYTFGNSKNTYHYNHNGLLDSIHTTFDGGENCKKYYYSNIGLLDSIVTTDLDKNFDNWKEYFLYDTQGRKVVDSSNSGNILTNTYKIVEVCHTSYLNGKTIDTLFNYGVSQTEPYIRKITTTTLDAEGDPISGNVKWNEELQSQITYSYIEKNGKKLLEKVESTGASVYTLTYTYNDAGQQIEENLHQKNGNGWIDMIVSSTYGEIATSTIDQQKIKQPQVLEISSLQANGTININAPQDGNLTGRIYTASGQLVSTISLRSIKRGMNTLQFGESETYSAGVYLVQISLNGAKFSKMVQTQ